MGFVRRCVAARTLSSPRLTLLATESSIPVISAATTHPTDTVSRVDSSANAYVTGLTYSDTGFPLTAATALQATYAGAGDAFLTKVNTTAAGAASLAYSTYLGGTGLTKATPWPWTQVETLTSPGRRPPFQALSGLRRRRGAIRPIALLIRSSVCEGDVFVAKLNPTLSGAASLLYFTYLGGSLADSGTGIAVDSSWKYLYHRIDGFHQFPHRRGSLSTQLRGRERRCLCGRVEPGNPPATALIYSTYLGGSNTDIAYWHCR